jgi:hypothetical protein
VQRIEQEIFPIRPSGTRRTIDILAKLPALKPITTAAEDPPAKACVGLIRRGSCTAPKTKATVTILAALRNALECGEYHRFGFRFSARR